MVRTLEVDDLCEYTGEDVAVLNLWQGSVGLVIDVPDYPDPDPAVRLVGGPTICIPMDQLRLIDEPTYRRRGERVLACLHPLREEPIRPPVFIEDHHWPIP